jgi:hypothetical protein
VEVPDMPKVGVIGGVRTGKLPMTVRPVKERAVIPSDDRPAVERFGSAKHPDRPVARERPAGLTDETVAALGKLSEALETVEHARGLLYNFHRLAGSADLALGEAVTKLREAGHQGLADEIDEVLVGRDVIPGYWTFQLVEEYDAGYWQVFRAVEQRARAQLGDVPPHLFEAEMKATEQGS